MRGAEGGRADQPGGRARRWTAGLTVASAGKLGAGTACELALRAERGHFASFEAFATLTGAACATKSLALGTGVPPIQLRTPPIAFPLPEGLPGTGEGG